MIKYLFPNRSQKDRDEIYALCIGFAIVLGLIAWMFYPLVFPTSLAQGSP